MDNFFYGIALIFSGGIISIFSSEKLKGTITAIFSGIGAIFLLIPSLQVLFSNEIFYQSVSFAYPIGEAKFIIDPLSAFFIMLISVMSFIGTVYGIGYIKPYLNQNRPISSHFFFLSTLIVSMLLVVVVSNALVFLIVWEIMSLSSFFLVVLENEKEEVFDAGVNYLIAMHIGVVFLIAGFVVLSIKSGSLDFESFKNVFESNKTLADTLFIVLFVGFGMKAGFIPLHNWLPKAHPAAPTHISGMMSGIMIKTGIYGILRIITLIGTPSVKISYFVLFISIISGVLGVMYAIAQHDLKKLLAYHSVENIGIIGIGIGVGMLGLAYQNNLVAVLGFGGGILHVLNHSIFKGLLFYGAGAVYQKTHTKDIEELGGVVKQMPYTAVLFLTGSIAISGLPPLNGFISEFLIYFGLLSEFEINNTLLTIISILSIAFLAFIGAMALLCFTKAFSVVFLGIPRSEKVEKASEVSKTMIFSMANLAILSALIGLLPQYAFKIIEKPVLSLSKINELSYTSITFLNVLSNISIGLFTFIGIFILIYVIRYLLLKNKSVYNYKTWDCGYQAGNSRMQYTGSSYASPFLSLIKLIVNVQFEKEKPEGLFPRKAKFESHSKDIFKVYVIYPLYNAIRNFLNLFSGIQSGSTQAYILYGLIFLIGVLMWIIGVID